MLSKSDIQLISEIFTDAFEDKFSKASTTIRSDIAGFKSEILGEIKKLREEVTVVTGYKDQIEDHEKRITKLEQVQSSPI